MKGEVGKTEEAVSIKGNNWRLDTHIISTISKGRAKALLFY
jgi:hypothetical protein